MTMPLLANEVAVLRPTRPQPIRRHLANALAEALDRVWAARFHLVAAAAGSAAAVLLRIAERS